jgi:hypothetical protein
MYLPNNRSFHRKSGGLIVLLPLYSAFSFFTKDGKRLHGLDTKILMEAVAKPALQCLIPSLFLTKQQYLLLMRMKILKKHYCNSNEATCIECDTCVRKPLLANKTSNSSTCCNSQTKCSTFGTTVVSSS